MPGYGTLGPAEGTGLLPWSTVRVRPRWAFGLDSDDFTGSPTRWTFEEDDA
jgi:hypothetical protein